MDSSKDKKLNNSTHILPFMKKSLFLDNWRFIQIEPSDLSTIKEIIPLLNHEDDLTEINPVFKSFKVPGTLQSNLAIIEDFNPYFEKNIDRFTPLENKCLILVHPLPELNPSKDYYLEFDWIDTNADIFLDGQKISSSNNAFLKKKIAIPKEISTTLLILILYPHMSYINEELYDFPPIKNPLDRVFVRKPSYNYGWDFSPRTLLIGIGSVEIKEQNDLTIEDIFVYTEDISENKASLNVQWSVQTKFPMSVDFSLEIFFKDTNKSIYKDIIKSELEKGHSQIKFNINLPQVELWWPNGYGKQNLYNLKISTITHDELKETTFGIRKIELVLKDKEKHTFIFKINDTKIWAKGANWVPTDSLLNYSQYKKYQTLLLLAKNANFNMIRIWGGGVVEKEEFYNLCDELGLMIWHDFQFACSVYPQTEEYLENVNSEVRGIIQRLRSHASIVLWNGNNENEWIDFQHYTSSYREEKRIGEKLHHLKMRACEELDPSRPYWRSSPWSPSSEFSFEFDPNSPLEGNRHNWEVWHGLDQPDLKPAQYEHYYNEKGILISEFGIQSLPVQETIDEIFSLENQNNYNEIWKFHNCNMPKIEVNLVKFKEPKNITDFIIYTQAAQAFGLKYAIDTWRERKWQMTGALLWQFNEPWPTICWSLIDYYNRPKMAYWFVKRSFEKVLPVYNAKDHTVSVINDNLETIKGQLTIREYQFPDVLIKETVTDVTINANDLSSLEYQHTQQSEIIYLEFESNVGRSINHTLMKNVVNLQISDPEIKVGYSPASKRLNIVSKEMIFILKLDPSLEPEENYLVIPQNTPYEVLLNKGLLNPTIKTSIWNHPEKSIKVNID
ncbi:MAG: glycosyl hydrolase 2 galactose-binding domain-containing protein [Candidatus Hodarchaeales archaeon]